MSSLEYILSIPIRNQDLARIEGMLAIRDVFTTSFQDSPEAVYRASTYLQESLQHSATCVFMLDRNVFTRILSLDRGAPADSDQQLAAGVLAFVQTAKAQVEMDVSLYEMTESAPDAGGDAACNEVMRFRRLDNSHPQLFADVAVGRSKSLDLSLLSSGPQKAPEADFAMPLRSWRACYACALKIAVIELQAGPAEQKLLALMNWMQDDALHIAPAFLLGSRYLAPNAQKKGLFKSLRSQNRTEALKGIRNATWDLVLVSEWLKRTQRQGADKRLWILASTDRAVHAIARELTAPTYMDFPEEIILRAQFCDLWGAESGTRLARHYGKCMHDRKTGVSPGRSITSVEGDKIISSLEAKVLEFQTTP